jgi:serine/threonine protein kinase/tetratricopeptide (TPR) repeat protein
LIGKTLAHYQILGLIGRGGMGEVYRARDTRLDRDVALKVLPADVASDPARLERFQREAKTVAGLNHSHIVTLHSVEEANGVHFLTMELVEGQALDEMTNTDGLPLAKVFDIGIAVADALAAAHEKGIVHRDLKPANVMIARDGRVKVLDFGLAKLGAQMASPDQSATEVRPITHEGTVMGTVPYMSPEQLRGQSIDHRSDIFSFGVLLYELATGRRPFSGGTNADISSSILTRTPAPVTQLKPDLPHHLGRIVGQCLEKEPEDRYQSAKDIRNELRALRREVDSGSSQISEVRPVSTPPAAPVAARRSRKKMWIGVLTAAVVAAVVAVIGNNLGDSKKTVATDAAGDDKTIAVLPFANMSGDPSQEFFSDGISEELLNLLSKVQDLRVAARTSSFSFKGQNVEIPEIAKRLNVAYVLEGSVRKAGDQVRVTAQLIHASDGYHVWSDTYDRKLDDIFAIQDEIAADVVKQLQVKLLGTTPTTEKTDPEAYAMFLQAVQVARQYTAEAFATSDSLLTRALEIDSTYAPAWNARAGILVSQASTGMIGITQGVAAARVAANRALELDPGSAGAYAVLAQIEMYTGDLAVAARHLEKAYASDPSSPRVSTVMGSFLSAIGREDEMLPLRQADVDRDPVNENAIYNLGMAQILSGRLDEGIATLRALLRLSPGNGVTHYQIGLGLLLKGDAKGALAEIEQETVDAFKMIGLPMAYHALGRTADSDAALEALIDKHGDSCAINIASIYAFRGDADNAFKWLEKERQTTNGFAEILLDPFLRKISNDPRWLPFLRKIGRAPEQLEKIHLNIKIPTDDA